MEKKGTGGGPEKTREIHVTVHRADSGPSLETCMISILASHLPGRRI